MKKKVVIGILIIIALVVVSGLLREEKSEEQFPQDYNFTVTGTEKEKGGRLLSIDISPSEDMDEVDSFLFVRSRVGIDTSLAGGSWPELETASEKFNYQQL